MFRTYDVHRTECENDIDKDHAIIISTHKRLIIFHILVISLKKNSRMKYFLVSN